MRLLAIICTLSLSICSLKAHNNYFLPGDAFFSVELSQETMKDWSSNTQDSFVFSYTRYDGEFMACGNIGYSNLKVTGITPELKKSLEEAYFRYRDNKDSTFRLHRDGYKTETNSVVMLIYNANFNGRLGIKYNEHWQSQGHGRYCGFVETAKSIKDDWQRGAEIPALKLDKPLLPFAHLPKKGMIPKIIDKAIISKAKNLKFNLVGYAHQSYSAVTQTCPNLTDIMEDKAYAPWTEILSGSFRELDYDGKEDIEDKFTIPLKPNDSRIPEGWNKAISIHRAINHLKFDSLDFTGITLRQAFNILRMRMRETQDTEYKFRDRISIETPLDYDRSKQINLSFKNATLKEILDAICKQTGTSWKITPSLKNE